MMVESVDLREQLGADENGEDEREGMSEGGEITVCVVADESSLKEQPSELGVVGVFDESFNQRFGLLHTLQVSHR